MKKTIYANEFRASAVKLANEIGIRPAAKQLNMPNGTLHAWAQSAKKGEKPKTNSPFDRPGNKNASGNKGGNGAPARNKHALKTGEHERSYLDELTENERELYNAKYDKYVLIHTQIKLLSLREYRMLKRIKVLYEMADEEMVIERVIESSGTMETQYSNRNNDSHADEQHQGSSMTQTTENTRTIQTARFNRWLALEDALSRVQTRKQAAIMSLHRMEMDDERLGLDNDKLSLLKQRVSGRIDLDALLDDVDLELSV